MALYIGLPPHLFQLGGDIEDDKDSVWFYTQEPYPQNANLPTPRKYSLPNIIDYITNFVQGEINTENADVYEVATEADVALITTPAKGAVAIITDADSKGNKGLTFFNGTVWSETLIFYVVYELYHDQTVAASTWTVTHNFGKKPLVLVFDDSWNTLSPAVQVSNTQVIITHNSLQTGHLILKA